MKNPDYEGDMSYYQKQLEEKGITKDMLNMDMYVGLTAMELQSIVDHAHLRKKEVPMIPNIEKSEETMWECRNCGHLVIGKKAPAVCPVCAHSQSYFEVRKENY